MPTQTVNYSWPIPQAGDATTVYGPKVSDLFVNADLYIHDCETRLNTIELTTIPQINNEVDYLDNIVIPDLQMSIASLQNTTSSLQNTTSSLSTRMTAAENNILTIYNKIVVCHVEHSPSAAFELGDSYSEVPGMTLSVNGGSPLASKIETRAALMVASSLTTPADAMLYYYFSDGGSYSSEKKSIRVPVQGYVELFGTLSPWYGNKTIKLYARRQDSALATKLHETRYEDGAASNVLKKAVFCTRQLRNN